MLTQAVGYASVAMGYLASHPGGVALVRSIAEDRGIPAPYLAKIIHQLARAGLVRTQRGVGGGVRLARPAEEITLYDLCVALSDPAIQTRCMLGIEECSEARSCPAHRFNTEGRDRLVSFLRSVTMQQIGNSQERARSSLPKAPADPA